MTYRIGASSRTITALALGFLIHFNVFAAETFGGDKLKPCPVSNCNARSEHQHRISKGKGGPVGEHTWTFTSSWGAPSTIQVWAPEDTHEHPKGLLVYLHGDGPADGTMTPSWDSSGMFGTIKKIAEPRGVIALTVTAPHIEGDTRRGWWENGHSKATYLNEVLSYMQKIYPVNLERVIFTGVSGGATLLNGLFIPRHTFPYAGGAAPLCGGYLNSINDMKTSPEFLANFHVRMVNGDQDFLLNYNGAGSTASNRILKAAGFDSELEVHHGGYAHCLFNRPMAEVLEGKVDEILSLMSRDAERREPVPMAPVIARQ